MEKQSYQWVTPAILSASKYSQDDTEVAIDQVKDLFREAKITPEEADQLHLVAWFVEAQGDLTFEVKVTGPKDLLDKLYNVVKDEEMQYPPFILRTKQA